MHPAPPALIGEGGMGTVSKVHPKEKQTNRSHRKRTLPVRGVLWPRSGCGWGRGLSRRCGGCSRRGASLHPSGRGSAGTRSACPRRPIDASLGRIVFCPCNLENSPLITCEEVGDPAPPRWRRGRGHSRPSPPTGGGGRNMGPRGERAGFKSRLQIH